MNDKIIPIDLFLLFLRHTGVMASLLSAHINCQVSMLYNFNHSFRTDVREQIKTYNMDFKDSIKQISDRIESLKEKLQTEEATKTALIMPLISALGYDVFNPMEVLPEMNCDIGMKKGEKIDYAILRDGEPIILIECKHWQQDLNLHDNQLLRYFNVSRARFGVLTNGIIYRFLQILQNPTKWMRNHF